jgi:hypothetical protein
VSTAQAEVGSGQVYALLADGTTVEIRPAGPAARAACPPGWSPGPRPGSRR